MKVFIKSILPSREIARSGPILRIRRIIDGLALTM
jgi:hypothetical protein